VTNADQSGRQHVEQEAADEFDRIESHDLGKGVIRVVFPVKADAAVSQSAKPVVGDGDAMSVAGQILEHAAGSTEGSLDVDHPFEVSGSYPTGPLLGESIFTRLAEELIHRYSIGRPRLVQYRGGLSGAQLRRVFERVDQCLNLDLTGNDVSSVAGLNKYHFGKAFRQSAGVTLHSYVLARRMRRAQQLLVKSELPLAVISEAAGFSNQSHFTSVFSTRVGIPPGAYRQMKRRVSVSFTGMRAP